jgi:hypothetical protein
MTRVPRLAAVLVAAQVTLIGAQAADFSGTWKLDPSRSRLPSGPALAGLTGAGAPAVLHITHPANGTLVVESQVNESHARVYVPGGKTTTPVFVGQSGAVSMASRWERRALVAEGRLESAAGAATAVKEVFALSADGQTLTIEVALGQSSSTLVYARTLEVGSCQSWPTPCKNSP